jgi:hypothetical protein
LYTQFLIVALSNKLVPLPISFMFLRSDIVEKWRRFFLIQIKTLIKTMLIMIRTEYDNSIIVIKIVSM